MSRPTAFADHRISVDVGGTFTDAILVAPGGDRFIGKALTTPERAFKGVSSAIANAGQQIGLDLGDLLAQTSLIIYGTTRATNAIVTRNVAKTAFLTTEGFPDILVMKEGGKTFAHDFSADFPEPYIPRRHTFEVRERMTPEGVAEVPFDEARARAVVATLKDRAFGAVAVCFLWSITNPDHELAMARLLDELMPGVPYTLSHRLNPVLREYRRASAAAIDASLKPLMQAHLRELDNDLRECGFSRQLLVSTSIGGCMTIDEVEQRPIHMAKSGPSMAPIAARGFARLEYGEENALVCDTGGTTFDVGLVRGGELAYTHDSWIGGRWIGHILGTSSVDIRSLGAGGGSIVWIDEGGMVRVGPQSAGAVPGPACYGRGGREPTVSDAACILGYLNPANFLGGRMALDEEAARNAFRKIADAVGKTTEETAYEVLMLASEIMIDAIRDVTVGEGYDPNEGVLVAGGGAAGINIMLIARELGTRDLVLPKEASALSATGMQFADILREEAATFFTSSENFDHSGVTRVLSDLAERLREFSLRLGTSCDRVVQLYAEARYANQVWELEVALPGAKAETDEDLARFVEAFHQGHERVFGMRDPHSAVEFVSWKGRLRTKIGVDPGGANAREDNATDPVQSTRDCFFGQAQPTATPIFDGRSLRNGQHLVGPCIVEEPTTTLVVYPGMKATVSGHGNYLLTTS